MFGARIPSTPARSCATQHPPCSCLCRDGLPWSLTQCFHRDRVEHLLDPFVTSHSPGLDWSMLQGCLSSFEITCANLGSGPQCTPASHPLSPCPKHINVLEGRWPCAYLLLGFFCLLLVACYNTSLFCVNYRNSCAKQGNECLEYFVE